MIPQIGEGAQVVEIVPYPSFTYRLTDMQVVARVDNIEAVKQAVFHILGTERYAHVIYDWNYSREFDTLYGRPLDFVEAVIEQRIKDALFQDERIDDVRIDSIERTDDNGIREGLHVQMTITAFRETFSHEVTVYV